MGLSLGVGKFVFASTRLGLRLIGLGKKKKNLNQSELFGSDLVTIIC